ncbi:biotin--[acetyl-CoA-carboxylase] ligase [uncultured Veillonella sp.]|uniref:biotin--[acetyl-CoA-carboxylase] ligase n=1 Tax=uncultured Veillonella sp. TaxID=159268 RepID=UPI00262A820E|nr:biotin--[acetyl-CoA-carboxylase] ligase [uncultured Veillonella sp.]
MRDAILELLKEHKGEFVSGQTMSDTCEISRTAIWKHIEVLRRHGYEIESFTKKGYRLLNEPDLVGPLEVEPHLQTKTFGRHYEYAAQVESTNSKARELAMDGAVEGTVVVAEEQVAGRGRINRGWYSPYGKGLWFSLILRPPFLPLEAPKCTLMGAVALVKAFKKLGLTTAGIKWPNDILVGTHKLVGILTEMSGTMDQITYIIMGIGINMNSTKDELPDELKDVATSFAIEGLTVDRREAFAVILKSLEEQYNKVLKEGFGSTLEEWKQFSVTLNQNVEVRAPGNTYEGRAIDLDQDGNLLVERLNGKIERIVAGDVSIRPAKVGG